MLIERLYRLLTAQSRFEIRAGNTSATEFSYNAVVF